MKINFPSNPTSGQLYTFANTTWEWSGEYWGLWSGQTGSGGGGGVVNDFFLYNQTHPDSTDIIRARESIFNPCDLEVLSSSVFIVEENSCYYVLGDLTNNGTIEVNGTIKIGGIFYNYGIITGSGIIE